MTSSEGELAEIRDRLTNDENARRRLVAGLGEALETAQSPAAANRGPIGELMAEAKTLEGPAREALLAKLADRDTLLWAPPKIARIVLEPRAGGSVLVLVG